MTFAQRATLVFGWAFVILGILGFAASGMANEPRVDLAPKLVGVFPVNALENVVHLLFGVGGLAAAKTFPTARAYCRGGGLLFILLAGVGAISADMWGLLPIGGADVWLHVLLGLGLAVIGIVARPAAHVPAPAAGTEARRLD